MGQFYDGFNYGWCLLCDKTASVPAFDEWLSRKFLLHLCWKARYRLLFICANGQLAASDFAPDAGASYFAERKRLGQSEVFWFSRERLARKWTTHVEDQLSGSGVLCCQEQITVEKKLGGSGTRSDTFAVINANYHPLLDACRGVLQKVCKELLRHLHGNPIMSLVWLVLTIRSCLNSLRANMLSVSSGFSRDSMIVSRLPRNVGV